MNDKRFSDNDDDNVIDFSRQKKKMQQKAKKKDSKGLPGGQSRLWMYLQMVVVFFLFLYLFQQC